MMTKLRTSVFAILSGVLLLPVAAIAQFDENLGGTETGLSDSKVSDIITWLMQWLLYIVGFLAIIAFIISGILYLTSAGDDTRTEKAKNAMIAAIIGVIVALIGLIAINAITTWLEGTNQTF